MTMHNMQGTVAAISEKGKGGSICIDDNWYSTYAASQRKGVEKGDLVEFAYQENGEWKNIKGDVKVTTKGAGAPTAPARSGGGNASPTARDKQIYRQNCMTQANSYVASQSLTKTPEEVIEIARVFESYVDGSADQ